jgi:hypothetical protein
MQNAVPVMGDDEEAVENAKGERGDGEKSIAGMASQWLLRNAAHGLAACSPLQSLDTEYCPAISIRSPTVETEHSRSTDPRPESAQQHSIQNQFHYGGTGPVLDGKGRLSLARLPNRDHLCAGRNVRRQMQLSSVRRSSVIDRLALRLMYDSHAGKSFPKGSQHSFQSSVPSTVPCRACPNVSNP